MTNYNLIDHFNKYFEMVPAISDKLKNEVYKLRYQVYCIENNFEPCWKFPDLMEFDDYDQHSVHYLIRHRKSGEFIATTRLILPDTNNPEKPFPIEINSHIHNVNLVKTMSRYNLAELSRFCVSKKFRQRKNEQNLTTICEIKSENTYRLEEKRNSSDLTLALFACAIKMSSENNIHYWYALMEPPLKRLVSRLGVQFFGIGPLVNYHGIRQPCVINVNDLLDTVAEKDLNYWSLLTHNVQFQETASFQFSLQKNVKYPVS